MRQRHWDVGLGLDGMDAVEFFQGYEKEFQVDLTDLWQHWDEFFGPEGLLWPDHLVLLAAGLIGVGAGLIVNKVAGGGLPTWVVMLIMVAVVALLLFLYGRFYLKPLKQICVADLVEAARQRKWQLEPID